MGWFKTTEMYPHSSGGHKVKMKASAGLTPSSPRRESSLASSSSGGSWCSLLVSTTSLLHLHKCLPCVSALLRRVPVTGFRTPLPSLQYDLILITYAKTLFLNEFMFTDLGVRSSPCPFQGCSLAHCCCVAKSQKQAVPHPF